MKDGKILLAMKKRGFGAGRWNGTGGKFDSDKGDKNILEAALRETEEEIGVKVKNPKMAGLFHFKFPHNSDWDQDVSLFVSSEWEGEPVESEEMLPKWFLFEEIPYKEMWPDDILWLPRVLNGEKVEGNFIFGEGDKILDYNVKAVDNPTTWLF